MVRISWNEPGAKTYETGLDRGVLYSPGSEGVAWVGLVSMTESISGGEVESFYYDGVKYLDVILSEDFLATLEAYNHPPEFAACDGTQQIALGLFATQQPRVPFNLSYRTLVGDDITEDAGYKIHLLYNCMAAPAEKSRLTKKADVEVPTTSWTIYTRPPRAAILAGVTYKPTAHLIIDSRSGNPYLANVETALYGEDGGPGTPYLPTQQQITNMLASGSW